ncbi:choline/ethanolamine kinase family protein [Synoicihabitans lomoniglobus]|uniref:Phosphotransferase family protein n=1 Tax=Synoicihabitans lomoniglobus TaxID=2909285 RepID=A0AAE9ZWC7_9BACT|nr:phosphotransferase family protein [Opitutaceae bacterium LMO-M01]WED65352.1 phosphotransferase family protein [Opitutaceae bacterium LMO-M01]
MPSTLPVQIEALIPQIPAWRNARAIRHERLSGGYSNVVHKLFVDDKTYAVRINGEQHRFLELNAADEVAVMMLAAEHGVSPRVLEVPARSDVLITEFIDGGTLSVESARDPRTLARITGLLKRIHQLPYSGQRCSTPFSLTRGYLRGIAELGLACPPDLAGFLDEMDRIEATRKKDPGYRQHYCHNDPFTHNLLEGQDGELKIIDWELSGLGDIWFDLATVSFSSGFDRRCDEILLESYFGHYNEPQLQTLHDMKFVCMVREIGWALMHTALERNRPNPGPGYMDFALSVLNRLKQGLVTLI